MKDGAPILHERLLTMTSPLFRPGAWGDSDKETNVANRFDFRTGDVEAGFAEADEIVEREFHTKPVLRAHQPHEPGGTAQTEQSASAEDPGADSRGTGARHGHFPRLAGFAGGRHLGGEWPPN